MSIQQIGKHTVSCGNVADFVASPVLRGIKIDILYSDPPWGEGNAKYWQTMVKRMTGEVVPQITSEAILENIFKIVAANVQGHVFIEYGRQWRDGVEKLFRSKLHNVRVVERKYYSGAKKLPNLIFYGGTHPGFSYAGPDENMRSEWLAEIIGPAVRSGMVICDPCCGMGNTARAAIKTGCTFIGNELNRVRLAKTIKSLEASCK